MPGSSPSRSTRPLTVTIIVIAVVKNNNRNRRGAPGQNPTPGTPLSQGQDESRPHLISSQSIKQGSGNRTDPLECTCVHRVPAKTKDRTKIGSRKTLVGTLPPVSSFRDSTSHQHQGNRTHTDEVPGVRTGRVPGSSSLSPRPPPSLPSDPGGFDLLCPVQPPRYGGSSLASDSTCTALVGTETRDGEGVRSQRIRHVTSYLGSSDLCRQGLVRNLGTSPRSGDVELCAGSSLLGSQFCGPRSPRSGQEAGVRRVTRTSELEGREGR